jgi:hypothetical protein
MTSRRLLVACVVALGAVAPWTTQVLAQAQSGQVGGFVADETGGALPGVTIELQNKAGGEPLVVVTGPAGDYKVENVPVGKYDAWFSLVGFGRQVRRDVDVGKGMTRIEAVMHLALSTEVTVSGKRTFVNLADAEDPAQDLMGIAESASQGAITARQLETRPIMRQGEVLETIPGVIITQHSGEGKANQYFLRGFNLDHGSDLAMTVAGTPVNMPTHAHSQGYSDINFLIPELVTGVQFSKGPYYADQGDFATAGSSNINYATSLERPIVSLQKGTYDYNRFLAAASPKIGRGRLLGAFETSTNSGPWAIPDSFKKYNGVVRYSQGDAVNGFSITGMGYHGKWNATEASPLRAVEQGLITRFGTIDPSDGGNSSRYAVAADWQRTTATALTRVQAYGLRYDLNLFSNFTFFLDDPVRGDQHEQVDRRFVFGGKVSQRRPTRWHGRPVQNSYGVQLRHDVVSEVALYHTEARKRLETDTNSSALVTSAGVYGENDVSWLPWLRTTVGLRGDVSRYQVDALVAANSGTKGAGIVSPKVGVVIGPWKAMEFYGNAGTGFHSNSALGTTLTRDINGNPVDPVTALVRAKGAEAGFRTVAIPHLQSTVSLWMLRLGSELVYNADIGATEPGPASARHGVEFANYYSPKPWLVFDGDVSLSRARFSEFDPAGSYVPEAVKTVVSAGVSLDGYRKFYGSLRWRYFGPRPLVQDNSIQSKATSLVNLGAGYQAAKTVRLNVDVFNIFDAKVSDIDYYFASRLPGEPVGGVEDIHFHPAVPRTVRVAVVVGF